MEITRSNVLTLALILSLGLNIYDVLIRFPHCDDTDRFSDKELPFGGNEVSHTWAKDHVEAYREAHATDETPYQTTGFMLSKKVFDKIFDNTTLNTLCVDLIENDEKVLSIVVKGITTDSTEITTGLHSGIFINQSMCPADCSQY